MKLQKVNVIYTVEDPKEIQYLKNLGFKEIKEKDVKKEDKILPPKDKEIKEKDVKKEDKILPPKDKEIKEKDDAKK